MLKQGKVTCVDLFAGAGGFSLAAQQAGFDISFAVENDKWAAETYRQNFSSKTLGSKTVLYEDDIKELCPIELRDTHFAPNQVCDLLLGGPPCQGFSTHRINDSGVDDPRNRLINRYFDFVVALRPRMFLMENVPGILWSRHQAYLDRFYEEGRNAGYYLFDPVILDARNYGIPQRRKRVFVLGFDSTLDRSCFQWPPAPTHGALGEIKKKSALLPWNNCSGVFRCVAVDDMNNVHMKHTPALVEAFANTPKNGGSRRESGRVLPCHKHHDGHRDVYGRIDPSQPAPTMTTACINPSKGRFVHPTKNHGITARQAARIQTFPDSFDFTGGLIAAGKQIGNAVPVELGRVLLTHLTDSLGDMLDKPARNDIPREYKAQI